jgi:hypothetical protein
MITLANARSCRGKLKSDDQLVATTWFKWIGGEIVQAA